MKKSDATRKYILFIVAVCLFCIFAISLTAGVDWNHECTGDSCVMCLATTVREQILNIMVLFFCAVAAFALPVFAVVHMREERFFFAQVSTPVNLKVKLSD